MPDTEMVTSERAKELFRFGWATAELRGRVFFGSSDPGRLSLGTIHTVRTGHMPPLGDERSAGEQLIEIKKVVKALAGTIGVTTDGANMADAQGKKPSELCDGATRILQLADKVAWSTSASGPDGSWNAFTEAYYQWDAQIQDALASSAFGGSSAYQLGRGLAETSWALDLTAAQSSTTSWDHMLGGERAVILTGLVVRLTPVLMSSTVAQAIKGSLANWERRVSAEPDRNSLLAVYLRRQISLWRDLILSGADPQSLVRPAAPLKRVASVLPALRALWPQILLALASSGLLSYAAYLMSQTNAKGLSSTIVAALGIFGITGATVMAKAKSTANSLLADIHRAVVSDLLVEGSTVLPSEGARFQLPTVYRPGAASAPIAMKDLAVSLKARSPALPPRHLAVPEKTELAGS